MTPLIIAKEHWLNSQLSVARFYGGISINGKQYIIMNHHLMWSDKIPADLVLRELIPAYHKLGRDKILELVKQGKSEKEIKEIAENSKEERVL